MAGIGVTQSDPVATAIREALDQVPLKSLVRESG
jgi:hypothetical protein